MNNAIFSDGHCSASTRLPSSFLTPAEGCAPGQDAVLHLGSKEAAGGFPVALSSLVHTSEVRPVFM